MQLKLPVAGKDHRLERHIPGTVKRRYKVIFFTTGNIINKRFFNVWRDYFVLKFTVEMEANIEAGKVDLMLPRTKLLYGVQRRTRETLTLLSLCLVLLSTTNLQFQ